MAYIKTGKINTMAYRFTVNTKDDTQLIKLKELVKYNNKVARKWGHYKVVRVSLMARGERKKWAVLEGHNPRYYDQNLPHKYATHFDVYVN